MQHLKKHNKLMGASHGMTDPSVKKLVETHYIHDTHEHCQYVIAYISQLQKFSYSGNTWCHKNLNYQILSFGLSS